MWLFPEDVKQGHVAVPSVSSTFCHKPRDAKGQTSEVVAGARCHVHRQPPWLTPPTCLSCVRSAPGQPWFGALHILSLHLYTPIENSYSSSLGSFLEVILEDTGAGGWCGK